MAVGDMAGKVLRATAGIMSEIDPKATKRFLKESGTTHAAMMNSSKAYKAGRKGTQFVTGGISGTAKAMKKGDGIGEALMKGHSTVKTVNGELTRELSAKKVAGTATAVGLGGRVLTGGGLYRDRYGNVNVPGVPFI